VGLSQNEVCVVTDTFRRLLPSARNQDIEKLFRITKDQARRGRFASLHSKLLGQPFEEKPEFVSIDTDKRTGRPLNLIRWRAIAREGRVHLCGESVQFVGNRWKSKIPRTRSRAHAVCSSGGLAR
jgi:hypothetical protein